MATRLADLIRKGTMQFYSNALNSNPGLLNRWYRDYLVVVGRVQWIPNQFWPGQSNPGPSSGWTVEVEISWGPPGSGAPNVLGRFRAVTTDQNGNYALVLSLKDLGVGSLDIRNAYQADMAIVSAPSPFVGGYIVNTPSGPGPWVIVDPAGSFGAMTGSAWPGGLQIPLVYVRAFSASSTDAGTGPGATGPRHQHHQKGS